MVTLPNDDEETPISLIGKKMVPILRVKDREPMPESLDIVRYADNLSEHGSPIMKPSRNNEELNKWLKDIRQYHYKLAMPRWVNAGLEEFETKSAQDYFIKKKELSIGPFKDNLAQTKELIEMAHVHLQGLENLIQGEKFFWNEFTEDDLHVFASLRCLTVVKDLKLPKKLDQYMNSLSEAGEVPLHWGVAI